MPVLPSTLLGARFADLAEACGPALDAAFLRIWAAFARGNKLLLCGNGGSAADCEHIVGELVKGFLLPRRLTDEQVQRLRQAGGTQGERLAARLQQGLPAVSLTGPASVLTAIGNDLGQDAVFAQQVLALGQPGDVLLVLSTSGTSDNILAAVLVARALGLESVALTGQPGGALAPRVDVAICAPATSTADVQELHLPLYHALCRALEAAAFVGA